MTRETKVGLIVAGSFIGLVAVVVWTKFQTGDAPPPDGPQIATLSSPTTGSEPEAAKPDKKHSHNSAQEPPKLFPSGLKPTTYLDPSPPVPGGSPLPGGPSFEDDQNRKIPQLKVAVKKVEDAKPKPVQNPVLPEVGDGQLLPPPPNDNLAVPGPESDKPKPIKTPPEIRFPASTNNSGLNDLEPPPPPTPKLEGDRDPLKQQPIPKFEGDRDPPKQQPIPKLEGGPAVPPLGAPPPRPAPEPEVDRFAPPPGPVVSPPPIPKPIVTPVDSKTKVPPVGDVQPPLGAGMKVDPGLQNMKIANNRKYVCDLGDTSYSAVSKRVYNDEKYGQALFLFNKKTGSPDNPRLTPGQTIYLPAAEFLEENFPSTFNNPGLGSSWNTPPLGGATNPNTTPIPQPPVSRTFTPPDPSIPTSADVTAPARLKVRAPAPGDSDTVKHYRVPSQGQSILDIAQITLGNRQRWSEIYRLNLEMRPEYPIPGGTDLRLPPDAVVP